MSGFSGTNWTSERPEPAASQGESGAASRRVIAGVAFDLMDNGAVARLLRNCEGDWFKSLGYAVRGWISRRLRFFLDNVTLYAALGEFQRAKLFEYGFPGERIRVIPNMVRRVTPGDAADLTRQIRRLWDDQLLCASMGAAAFSKCRREYSVDVHARQWDELLAAVVGAPAAVTPASPVSTDGRAA